MKDHNREKVEQLKERINELEAVIIQRDDQMRELQHQLAAARAQVKDMTQRPVIYHDYD